MTILTEAAGVRKAWRVAVKADGPRAICRSLIRLRRFARSSPALVALAGLAAATSIVEALADRVNHSPPAVLIALALVAGLAGAAARAGSIIARWADVLGLAFDAAPAAQLIAARDGRAVQTNLAFDRLFHDTGEASLEQVKEYAVDVADVARLHALCEQAASGSGAAAVVDFRLADGNAPRQFEVAVEPAGGRPGYHLWRFRELDAAGSQGSASADIRPLAPWHSQDASRARPDEQAQRFFLDAPVGIAVVDRAGRFVRANPALGELFGAAPETLVGRVLIDFLDRDDRAAVAAKLAGAARGREARVPVEVRLEAPRERALVMLLSHFDDGAAPGMAVRELPADGLEPAGALPAYSQEVVADALTLYFTDVTERKNLEAQFAQSQKMQAVGQLAGGVAHDFNNLLTAMIGFCDLLLLRARPGDPAFADIMQIKQNASRAANLVRQLLAFSRQQSLQPRVLDVTDVLAELSHLLRRLIGENIDLEFDHESDLGLVKVDQGQLEQVVINLAVNARDAMPDGGRLTIRTENAHHPQPLRRGHEIMPAGDYVLVEVADTGIGISPDNLGRIFEPFFSTKSVGSGTGLGLSTVYGIVKQTGGFVFVDSVCGRGTTFAIYLPRHHAEPDGNTMRGDADVGIGPRDLTGRGTVMLVEDDDAVRMFGARALRNKGYQVIEAKTGQAALDMITRAACTLDLLITDVVMPQMDGPALIREVREVDPGIKVIFISGYTEDAFRQRLDADRDIHFLAKPFSLQQLAVKVKDVLNSNIAGLQLSDCRSEQKEYSAVAASRCAAAPAVE